MRSTDPSENVEIKRSELTMITDAMDARIDEAGDPL